MTESPEQSEIERKPQDLRQGDVFQETLEIIQLVGRGGTASVYKAKHLRLDKAVALKLLQIDIHNEKGRFLREAKTLCKLNHPNIVQLYACGVTASNCPYFIMEFVEGTPLSQILSSGSIEPSRLLNIARQICLGMEEAHIAGLIHRDLKPSNILLVAGGEALTESKNSETVKIIDFGMAKNYDGEQSLTREGAIVGTPFYMSPEQAKSEKIDARCDIYSLGCLLYEAATGRSPFEYENPFIVLSRHANEPIHEIPAQIPKSVKRIILKALQKEPSARYQTMREMLNDVEPVLISVVDQSRSGSTSSVNKIFTDYRKGNTPKILLAVVAFLALTITPVMISKMTLCDPDLFLKNQGSTNAVRFFNKLKTPQELVGKSDSEKIEIYERCLERNSRASPIEIGLAHYYLFAMERGLPERANEATEHCVSALPILINVLKAPSKLRPNLTDGEWANLSEDVAVLLMHKGDYLEAERVLRHCLSKEDNKENWDRYKTQVCLLTESLLMQKKPKETLAELSQLDKIKVQFTPWNIFEIHIRRAKALTMLSRRSEAENELNLSGKGARACPAECQFVQFQELANAYRDLGAYASVAHWNLLALNIRSDDRLKLEVAKALSRINKSEESMEFLKEVFAQHNLTIAEQQAYVDMIVRQQNPGNKKVIDMCARQMNELISAATGVEKLDRTRMLLEMYQTSGIPVPRNYLQAALVLVLSSKDLQAERSFVPVAMMLQSAGFVRETAPVLSSALKRQHKELVGQPMEPIIWHLIGVASKLTHLDAGTLPSAEESSLALSLLKDANYLLEGERNPEHCLQFASLAKAALKCGEVSLTEKYDRRAYEAVNKLSDHAELAVRTLSTIAINELGIIEYGKREPKKNLELFESSIRDCRERARGVKNSIYVGDQYRLSGIMYMMKGQTLRADREFSNALRCYRELVPPSQAHIEDTLRRQRDNLSTKTRVPEQ